MESISYSLVDTVCVYNVKCGRKYLRVVSRDAVGWLAHGRAVRYVPVRREYWCNLYGITGWRYGNRVIMKENHAKVRESHAKV